MIRGSIWEVIVRLRSWERVARARRLGQLWPGEKEKMIQSTSSGSYEK